jgi:glutamate-ammonia-ligase adenylyltransferase
MGPHLEHSNDPHLELGAWLSRWLDGFPGASLAESQLAELSVLAIRAPALFAGSTPADLVGREPVAIAADPGALRRAWVRACAEWALDPSRPLGPRLTEIADAAIRSLAAELDAPFDVVALGSYASEDMSPHSDVDLLLLCREDRSAAALDQAMAFFGKLREMRAAGSPIKADLHTEGHDRLPVLGYERFTLGISGLSPWERHELGRARSVVGGSHALDLVRLAAYREPLTRDDLRDLMRRKREYETERVPTRYRRRQLKLGYGGLDELEWMVELLLLCYPSALPEDGSARFADRVHALARARLVNSAELEQLLHSHAWLVHERAWVALQGFTEDVMPENPDKLDRLAEVAGLADGNAFLARHQHVQLVVRSLFEDALKRLRFE